MVRGYLDRALVLVKTGIETMLIDTIDIYIYIYIYLFIYLFVNDKTFKI